MAVTVVVLATGALYLSTLCRNSMSAFVLSIPVLAATAALSSTLQGNVARLVYHAYRSAGRRPRFLSTHDMLDLWLLFAAGLVATLLWLGFVNHRTTERCARRATRQALAIAAYIAAGLTAVVFAALR